MAARLLDGAAVAQAIRDEIRPSVEAFAARAGRPPGLGVVLVGDDPASQIYVRHKLKAAGETGFRADLDRLPGHLVAGRIADGCRPVESERCARRHPGSVAAAPGEWEPMPSARLRPDPRPTRTLMVSSRQRRASRCRTGAARGRLHAFGRD